MVSFSVKARVKRDGRLQVAIPTGLPETDVDVLVVVRPVVRRARGRPCDRLVAGGLFRKNVRMSRRGPEALEREHVCP